MSAVHSPGRTSVATTTVKASPASASSPCAAAQAAERLGDPRGTLDRRATAPASAAAARRTSTAAAGTARPGCACIARRLPRLPTAQPSPPHSVSRTGTRVAPPSSPARCAAMPAEARRPRAGAQPLPSGDPLAQEHRRQHHRERRRGLQDERREPGRHAGWPSPGRGTRTAATPNPKPYEQDPAPRRGGPGDQQQGRDREEREPQRDEEERRELLERQVDRREVQAPAHGDEDGEQAVAGGHRPEHAPVTTCSTIEE